LHNLAMTRLRRTSTRPRHITLDDAQEDVFAQAPSQEDGLRYRELLQALDRLPEEQKSVLLLATVEGLSYAETASVLDIPLGTVMSRLSRARERLLKEIDGQQRAAPVAHLRRVK
jgi:RNA polymerase sigma-70 factor (ECF subfamily)